MTDPDKNLDSPEALRELDDQLGRFWRRLRSEPVYSPKPLDKNLQPAHSPSGLRLATHRHSLREAEYVRVVDADAPSRIVGHVYLLHWSLPGPEGHAVTVIVRSPQDDAPSLYACQYRPYESTPPDLALRLLARHTRTRMRLSVVQDVELGDCLPASVRRALALRGDVQVQYEDCDLETWHETLYPRLFDDFDERGNPELFDPFEDGPYFDAALEEIDEAEPVP